MIHMIKERYVPEKEVLEKFGEVLFGEYRGKGEPDTDYEKRVFDMIRSWIHGGWQGKDIAIQDYALEIFRELLALRRKFPDVLKPNPKGDIFRAIGPEALIESKSSAPSFDEFKKSKGVPGYYFIRHTYTPYKPVEAWTNSFKSAESFIENEVSKFKSVPLIVKTTGYSKKNLLFDMSFLNAFSQDMIGKEENEVLRVSKESIPAEDASYYIHKDNLDELKKLLNR